MSTDKIRHRQNRTAVVTGSSHGIGKAIAAALLERGINVVVSAPELSQCRAAVRDMPEGKDGARAFATSCDIRSKRSLARLRKTAEAEFGRIALWVNNAGVPLLGTELAALPEDEWRQMVDVNLTGTLLACQTAIAAMQEHGGAIYNVLGAGDDGVPVPHMGGYATTKAALSFFTRSLAGEMDGSGILVGGLSPGLIISTGFLREHAKTPASSLEAREKFVNLVGDHPETAGRWSAKIIDTNRQNGRVFRWLTPAKIRQRLQRKGPRDILSRYRPYPTTEQCAT